MPPKRNSLPRLRRGKANQEPPPVMTWGKAAPVLIIAVVFDSLRFMFTWFIFFGPALAALACTLGVNEAAGTSVSGAVGQAVAAGCTVAAGVVGFFGAGVIESFGIVMAMATGFAGWLIVGLMLLMFNGRIFKENFLWFLGSLFVSEVPFVNSIPAITIAMWRMHHVQIRVEKAAYKKWEKEQAASQQQERNQQTAGLMQARVAQVAQAEQQAMNDAVYAEAANDAQYAEEIPEEVRKRA